MPETAFSFGSRLGAVALALIAVSAVSAVAADRPKKYVPPTGFAGHEWGELRTKFDGLPQEPLGVGAAYILPKEKQGTFTCVPGRPSGGTMSGVVDGCDFQATLLRLRKEYEGGGFYVLSEYAIPDQGLRMGDEKDGVLLHPVVWQFCANWSASVKKKEEPPNFDDINQFCGMRLQFQSESREQLAKLPADHVTVYDRMLKLLLAKFGEPANYARRGKVVIETEEGETADNSERKFSIYRWCPAGGDGFHTSCKASVVMSINPVSGLGTVLYSTPLLWEYADARDTNHKGDKLYKLLHAKQ
ncbi:MAG TPA: hypothetical protein VM146_08680 [Steroidobacteraceae bacterium]|nr:hypothetical protein [Steroidobacteraceae bacterium]